MAESSADFSWVESWMYTNVPALRLEGEAGHHRLQFEASLSESFNCIVGNGKVQCLSLPHQWQESCDKRQVTVAAWNQGSPRGPLCTVSSS